MQLSSGHSSVPIVCRSAECFFRYCSLRSATYVTRDLRGNLFAMGNRSHVSSLRDDFRTSARHQADQLIDNFSARARCIFPAQEKYGATQEAICRYQRRLLNQRCKVKRRFGQPSKKGSPHFSTALVPSTKAIPIINKTARCGLVSTAQNIHADIVGQRTNFGKLS